MPIPVPGLNDVISIYERLFHRLVVKLEACGPCHAPDYLASIALDVADGTKHRIEEEIRTFTNRQEVPRGWTAAELIHLMEMWSDEHQARKIVRKHFERLRQRLEFMEDAPTLEKVRFLLALLTSNRKLFRPVTQTLVDAAGHPDFIPPAAEPVHNNRAFARLEWDEHDGQDRYSMTCGIYIMGRERAGLYTSRRATGPRLKSAAQAICAFDISPLDQLLSLSLQILDVQIRAYEDLAPVIHAAIERKRPLLVRFKVILPPNNTAPAFEPERYLCIVHGARAGANGSGRIELTPVVSVESGKEAPFANQGEYFCLSSRPVQEIEPEWAQAQRASVQLRLRSRTTGLFKDRWLTSPVVPTRTVLPS